MCVLDKKRSRQGPGNPAAGDETSEGDRELLQEKRQQRSDHAATDCDRQAEPGRRLLHEISRDLKTDREAQRRYEEPEKFSPEKEDGGADDDADDGNGQAHKEEKKSQIPSSKSQVNSEKQKRKKEEGG